MSSNFKESDVIRDPSGKFDGWAGKRQDPGTNIVETDVIISDDQLMDEARKRGWTVFKKVGHGDVDDYAQEAIAKLLEARRSRNSKIAMGEKVERMNEQAYLTKIASEIAGQSASGRARFEDRRAGAEFSKQRDELERELGRSLTPKETDDLSNRIRMSFPAGARPVEGFHNRIISVSMDASFDSDEGESASRFFESAMHRQSIESGGQFEPGSVGDELAQKIDDMKEGGKKVKRAIGGEAWDAIRQDAPPIRTDKMSSRKGTLARNVIKNAGGAHEVAKRYLDGMASPAEAEALFSPFISKETTSVPERMEQIKASYEDAQNKGRASRAAMDEAKTAHDHAKNAYQRGLYLTKTGTPDGKRNGQKMMDDAEKEILKQQKKFAENKKVYMDAKAQADKARDDHQNLRKGKDDYNAQEGGKEAIAKVLASYPNYADDMWLAATRSATVNRSGGNDDNEE